MKLSAILAFGVFLILSDNNAPQVNGDEIGFIEDFSLATDRSAVLSRLIPGTDDYYYYHCLHAQNTEQFDEVATLLKRWEKTRNNSEFSRMPRVREIRHRQALLTYHRDPKCSLEYLKRELGLRFDHQRERLRGDSQLPTQLSPSLISREAFRRTALRRHRNLDGFHDRALAWLANEELTADQRRDLLSRLTIPDVDSLVAMVYADLRFKGSRGFGSLPIHNQLTLQQLDELAGRQPAMLNDNKFVNAYLIRLLPNDDIDTETSNEQKRAHLERVWKFVQTLPPAHNSLKANVLFHTLTLDLAENKQSKARLLEYLKLPRPAPYVNDKFLHDRNNRRFAANLNADFSSVLRLSRIKNDEPLVREYLQHFFVKATQYKEFAPYVDSDYLKRLFAETKLLNGLGDAERWYAMLSPNHVQELKQRVQIEFPPSNRTRYRSNDQVHLSLDIKNVPTLLVKVYRINAANYYQQMKREINTDINLDGLVAKHEKTYHYDDAPVRQIRRNFAFPQLDRAGTYVIDFIGNGLSSRALIRKGSLRYLSRMSDAGQLITILDESGAMTKDARLWLAGREYTPNRTGRILIPYTNQPTSEKIVLTHGDVASLKTLVHHGEEYSLKTGFYVDRESLLAGNQASLLIRPGLYLNGIPVSRTLLSDVRLTITSVDHDEISTSKTVAGLQLSDNQDLTHEIRVPERTSKLTARLEASIKLRTTGKSFEVSSNQSWQINAIDKTSEIAMANLIRSDEGYAIELVGKNGEPMAARAVNLRVKHRDFTDEFTTTLQTNSDGIARLGMLDDIERVATGKHFAWQLRSNSHTFPRSIHANVDEIITLPIPDTESSISRAAYALFELRLDRPTVDRFESMSIKNGLLQIAGLTEGDYALHLKHSGHHIRLRISDGDPVDGVIVSDSRMLERRETQRLSIVKTSINDDGIAVQLANINDSTRVHVFATRYSPAFDAFAHLSAIQDAEPFVNRSRAPQSLFIEGRRLGDEIQYVLNRRFHKKFPGNMLDRPEVLLNPWAIRDTATSTDQPDLGQDFEAAGDAQMDMDERMRAKQAPENLGGDFANLDFLASGSATAVNMKPNENGVVQIPKSNIGNAQQVVIVAVDFHSATSTIFTLPSVPLDRSDLRLAKALPSTQNFSQQRRIEFSPAGTTFELPSTSVPEIKVFDSIASVYSMFETISNDATLRTFRFILDWTDLSERDKQAKYSEFACHELNFYLFKKDPPFFESTVKPHLLNKHHKTFLDHWLLQDDLSGYLEPWSFAQLNTFEHILLAQRIDGERPGITRLLQDRFDRVPLQVDLAERFMAIALKQDSLRRQPSTPNTRLFSNRTTRQPRKEEEARGRERGLEEGDDGLSIDFARTPESVALSDEIVDMKKSLSKGRYLEELSEAGQLYRPSDTTREWAENNYYHVPINKQTSQLIGINAFWADYAKSDSDSEFYSTNFAHAANSFAEMMMALAVLDLPTKPTDPKIEFTTNRVAVQATTPLLIAHESIQPTDDSKPDSAILVSQNFYKADDRFRIVGNQRYDKFITEEFVRQVVYGCQVVITNTTSSPQMLSALVQLPSGALPVAGAQYTRSKTISLAPYRTETVEYQFYFPKSGHFDHYPVHVNRDGSTIATSNSMKFNVVDEATVVDRDSWNHLSQHGDNEQVLNFLQEENLQDVALDRIAFRLSDKEFFESVVSVLRRRHVYDHTLWSYSILHALPDAVSQYLQNANPFLKQCGEYLESELIRIDPVARKTYQHLEYRPLVNARAHQLGSRRKILNDRFREQYHRWLKTLSYRSHLSDADCMAATYYLLLQDRVEEAWSWFERINPENLSTRIQYDYATAYFDFFKDDQSRARSLANRYAEYPVDRWRNLFANVSKQLTELDGGTAELADPSNREQRNDQLAASDASFDLSINGNRAELNYRNLAEVTVSYYLMDIELLFSRNPFVTEHSNQFSFIEPNVSHILSLPGDESTIGITLPDSLRNKNVLVEISGSGQTQAKPFFSNSMEVFVQERYGQIQVTSGTERQSVPKAYVKVYALGHDGSVQFYKDGYTDLRGRFDYASLSTSQLDNVKRFSMLIVSEDLGAEIREALPPKQ